MDKLYINAGQMKAGTTYLYRLIKNHRQLYETMDKEIHFLAHYFGIEEMLSYENRRKRVQRALNTQLPQHEHHTQSMKLLHWAKNYMSSPDSFEWYYKAFQNKSPGQWGLDFSNLTCNIPPQSLRKIHRHVDDVRVTYCYRDPLERAFSHLKFHLKFSGETRSLDALSENEIRALIRSKAILPQANTKQHLDNLSGAFSDEKLRIIVADDLWSEPQRVINSLINFLDIEPIQLKNTETAINVGPTATFSDKVRRAITRELQTEMAEAEKSLAKHKHLIL